MTSALTSRGSTWAWRKIKNAYAEQLAHLRVVKCWRAEHNASGTGPRVAISPKCTLLIRDGDPWVLGHRTDRALGGDDNHLGYECKPCSDFSGGKLGAWLRKALTRPTRNPSRTW